MASESDNLAAMNSESDLGLGLNLQGRIRFSKIYSIEDKLDHLYQDSLDLNAYYTRFTTLWDELKKVEDSPSCTCNERRKSVIFLMRLSDRYSQVRKEIIMMEPFPDFNTIYGLVSQAEQHAGCESDIVSQAEQHAGCESDIFCVPPGCEFSPTDEDIMLLYLKPYLEGKLNSLIRLPIHRVNIYKSNPNQLTGEYAKANKMDWFFISGRTKVGKSGKRINRSDNNGGSWRVTVAAKKIYSGQGLVGSKYALEYYVNGVKGDWLMHEYWFDSSNDDKKDWGNHALCKIYLSPAAAKKKKALEEEMAKQKKAEDDFAERGNHALYKIYPSPEAAKEKNAEEEEIEKQKKEEGSATVPVDAALDEQILPCPSPYDELKEKIYLSPAAAKKKKALEEEMAKQKKDEVDFAERGNHALYKIYLCPEAANEKNAEEEEIEKQTKDEGSATVPVDAALDEQILPCPSPFDELKEQILPCPSPFDELKEQILPCPSPFDELSSIFISPQPHQLDQPQLAQPHEDINNTMLNLEYWSAFDDFSETINRQDEFQPQFMADPLDRHQQFMASPLDGQQLDQPQLQQLHEDNEPRMEPIYSPLPIGYKFRPTKLVIAIYFLKKKALGQPILASRVPGECNDIFFRHPRDLPGYPREEHWYYFCRKRNHQVTNNPHNLWTPTGKETNVLDPNNNGAVVGIRRRFTLVEKDKEEEYDWFMDEIRLPQTVADSIWVMCHIKGKRIEPEFDYLPVIESESESEDEETVVDNAEEILDLLRKQDGNVLPPPPPSP